MKRVVTLVEGGMARAEVAALFGIGLATLKRWLVLAKTRGDLRPTSLPGQTASIPREQAHELRTLVARPPDATLAAYAELWNSAHPATVRQWTMGRAIRKLDLSRKKDAACV